MDHSRSSKPPKIAWYNHAALACYLEFIGFEVVEVRWVDGPGRPDGSPTKLCKWAFEKSRELSEAIDNFFAENAQVEPRAFFDRVTDFKKRMYDANPEYVKHD